MNTISRLLNVLVILLMVTSASAQSFSSDYKDSYPKNPGIDVLNYVFELTLTDDSDSISGATTVDVRFLTGGQNEFRLDLINRSDALEGKGMSVSKVSMDGNPLTFRHESDQVFIQLGKTIPASERIQIKVEYHGIPAGGLKIAPNKHGDRAFFSDNWSSRVRNWLPTVDHPSDKSMSELLVTAPSHYLVVSNGVLIEEMSLGNGMKFSHWKNSVPIATWLFQLSVADFAVQYVDEFDGKSIQTWVARQDREAGFYDFAEPTKKVLQYYTDLVGPYSYEKLANIVSHATGGGMEAASAIAYGENSVTGDRSRRWQHVIIHEIAHQWFGNAVTEADWNDVWLSEGFATYYTLLYREHDYGHDDFVEGIKDARNRVVNYYKDNYDFAIVRDYVEDLNDVSGAMMYQKGAWVLHMLREKIGIDTYNKGVRTYYAEYQDKNARSADFIRHMEEASGMNLQSYFNQWLRQGGIPNIEASWKMVGQSAQFELAQNQATYRFELDVDVVFRYADGSLSPMVTVTMPNASNAHAQAKMEVPTGKKITEMIIDPNTRLLATWNIKGNKTK